MEKHSFTRWLRGEITASRCALIKLYEQRDRLRYIEGPALEREYMNAVGDFEEEVIREEIEVELLQKKREMIQAAVNRHEPIDEAAIDAELDEKRSEMYREAAGENGPQSFAQLAPEKEDELQKLYQEIVRDFHPQMHPEQPEACSQLFRKAQDAYRRRDLPALRLIHDMLYAGEGGEIEMALTLELLEGGEDDFPGRDYSTDYALAALLYDCFQMTADEAAIREEWENYRLMCDSIMAEVEQIRAEFPFTAAEMLDDPAKLEEYKQELQVRLQTARRERERRTREIQTIMESVRKNG